jgi:hypothetical protein
MTGRAMQCFWGMMALMACAAYGQQMAVAVAAKGPGTGTISGTVLDETGKPIAGATVSLALELPAAVKGVAPVAFTPHRALAISAKDGTFSAGNMPAGLTKVCVQVANSDYLETCRWPVTQTRVTIGAGQTVKLPAISMAKGFRRQIRVNDLQGVLTKTTVGPGAAKTTPAIILGAFAANHMFTNAQKTGQDATGYDYAVLVPFDLPLQVSVFSKAVALADSTGKAASGGGVVKAVTIASGTAIVPVTQVSVTGLAGK